MYCQKCRNPLKSDSSLEDLNPLAFSLLVGSTTTQQPVTNLPPSRSAYPQERKYLYDRISRDVTSPMYKQINVGSRQDGGDYAPSVIRGGIKDKPEMSFYLLSESEVVVPAVTKPDKANVKAQEHDEQLASNGLMDEGKAMSHEMERVSKLFEILSARSDVDHPICTECTELLVEGLQKRLEAATRERDAYTKFLKHIQGETPLLQEIEENKATLNMARDEEAAALKDLMRLEAEKIAVDDVIADLKKEARALDREEEQFWMSRNLFSINLAEFQNERDSVNLKYDYDSQQLEKLQRTNVYNDTFCISHDGSFGTINGLRLGRLSNVPVDWPEINAAWGHTILLLATVAEKLGFKFEGYELQPMGSTSRILKMDYPSPATSRVGSSRQKMPPKNSILELYSSGDMPLGLTFIHRKFDNAMVAFLECMRQLGSYVEQETAQEGRPLKLPYKIEGEKIDDVSIRLGIAQDDLWSKACKYTLTCS